VSEAFVPIVQRFSPPAQRVKRKRFAETFDMASTSGEDWANLTAGPAGHIAERVLSNDYVDFLRFHAVCRAWRTASAHLRANGVLDRRFHPRRWILLWPNYKHQTTRRRRFLNVVTGELIRVPLKGRLLTCDLLGQTAEGLLVLCRRDDTHHAVQLRNPLTGQIAILPNASSLLDASGERLQKELTNFVLHGAGLAGDSMVALCFQWFSLSVARPGDMFWTCLTFHDMIKSALPFQGRICLANSKNISTVEATASHRPPRHAVAAVHGRGAQAFLGNDMFLANNDGELILGYHVRSTDEPCNHRKCSVYRVVKLDSGDMASLATLKGRALFTGTTRSVVVSTEVSPSVDADTVYVCTFKKPVTKEPKVIACDLTCTSAAAEVKFDRKHRAFYLARYVATFCIHASVFFFYDPFKLNLFSCFFKSLNLALLLETIFLIQGAKTIENFSHPIQALLTPHVVGPTRQVA
jgi:hypothetical protein